MQYVIKFAGFILLIILDLFLGESCSVAVVREALILYFGKSTHTTN